MGGNILFHMDEQIVALWDWTRGMSDSYDDMNFTPQSLSSITTSTLIVYGDRDPLYPVELAVEMYHAVPHSALWVVPNGGHGPVFLTLRLSLLKRRLRSLAGRLADRLARDSPNARQSLRPGVMPIFHQMVRANTLKYSRDFAN